MSTRATTVARQAFNIAAKHFCDCASPSDFPENSRVRRAFMTMLKELNKEWHEIQREHRNHKNSAVEANSDSVTDPFINVVRYRF